MPFEKDKAEKELLNHNDVFAAAVNAFLPFLGEIAPDDLQEERTRLIYKGNKTLQEMERDVVKRITKDNICIAIAGIENQTKSDASLPERILAYSGLTAARWLHDGNNDSLPPIYTIVFYFGPKDSWKHPQSLYKRWNIDENSEIPGLFPNIKPFVIDVGSLSEEMIQSVNSDDLRAAFQFIWNLRHAVDNETYNWEGFKLSHPMEISWFIQAVTNQKEFKDADEIIRELGLENGGTTMEQVIWLTSKAERERIGAEKRAEGKAEGKAEKLKSWLMKSVLKNFAKSRITENGFGIMLVKISVQMNSFAAKRTANSRN